MHYETGRRFLAGEFLYADGHDFPYPPFFAMLFALPALLPLPAAKAILYPIAIAVLLVLAWTLQRIIRSAFALDEKEAFWISVAGLFFCIQFILRDQAEVGLNTAIAAFIWLGVYFWRQDRDLLAGTSLGLAIAIKCTPAIFLAYFIWKRQWRIAICTALAALFFTVLPIVCQGPASWSKHIEAWATNAVHGISGTGSGYEVSEMSRTKNLSLRPSLMNYLTRLPEASRRSWDPGIPFIFLNLSPSLASWLTNSILLAILATFLWWSREKVVTRNEPRVWELAATGALMLLFSPITWSQHCVILLPACFLIATLFVVRDRLPGWVIVVLSFYVFFCALLGRDLIGRVLFYRIQSYHVSTFCIAALFAVILAGPRLQRAAKAR